MWVQWSDEGVEVVYPLGLRSRLSRVVTVTTGHGWFMHYNCTYMWRAVLSGRKPRPRRPTPAQTVTGTDTEDVTKTRGRAVAASKQGIPTCVDMLATAWVPVVTMATGTTV